MAELKRWAKMKIFEAPVWILVVAFMGGCATKHITVSSVQDVRVTDISDQITVALPTAHAEPLFAPTMLVAALDRLRSERKEAGSLSDSDVRVATFYHMFEQWRHPSREEHFYLSVEGAEMLPNLLARFKEEGFPVSPGSEYEHGLGVLCSIDRVEVVSERKARVYGGYLFGELGGAWGYFELERAEGRWRVLSWSPEIFAYLDKAQPSATANVDKPAWLS